MAINAEQHGKLTEFLLLVRTTGGGKYEAGDVVSVYPPDTMVMSDAKLKESGRHKIIKVTGTTFAEVDALTNRPGTGAEWDAYHLARENAETLADFMAIQKPSGGKERATKIDLDALPVEKQAAAKKGDEDRSLEITDAEMKTAKLTKPTK